MHKDTLQVCPFYLASWHGSCKGNVPEDALFLCDRAAVRVATINEALYTLLEVLIYVHMSVCLSVFMLSVKFAQFSYCKHVLVKPLRESSVVSKRHLKSECMQTTKHVTQMSSTLCFHVSFADSQ